MAQEKELSREAAETKNAPPAGKGSRILEHWSGRINEKPSQPEGWNQSWDKDPNWGRETYDRSS